jgi:hypothetical protein
MVKNRYIFEKGVKIFEPKTDEVGGEWKTLSRTAELHDLKCDPAS